MNVTRQKIVDLKAVRNARIRAEEMEAPVASEAELARLDPVHKESFGRITIEVFKVLKADQGLIRLLEKMQASRMGFYLHEGFSGRHVRLRELVTGEGMDATVPSGYKGQPGEIWLARFMPDPFEELPFGYSVVFTTPYVIGRLDGSLFHQEGDQKGLQAFFDRTLGKTGKSDNGTAYENLMKYGLNRLYWNEYIFQRDREQESFGRDEYDRVIYRGVKILWPVILFQTALLRWSAAYQSTGKEQQANLYRLEQCAESALNEYDASIARECLGWLDLSCLIAATVKHCEDAGLVSDTTIRFGEGRSVHGEGYPKDGRLFKGLLANDPQ